MYLTSTSFPHIGHWPTSIPRAAAQRVYNSTKGRSRDERLRRARTDLLIEWRESLLPGAGGSAGRGPGRLAGIVDELAEVVLQLYRQQRGLFIGEVRSVQRVCMCTQQLAAPAARPHGAMHAPHHKIATV